ncbi:MAG: AEC family transporter [Anaerolineales bacterium]
MSFSNLITTFTNNLLPIILISGVGFLFARFFQVDSRSVGRVIFYIFSPILVFNLLLKNTLPLDAIAGTVGFALVVYLATGILILLIARALRLSRPLAMTLLLTALFGNTGNYGLPLVSFAFGRDALAHASLYFVTSSILFNTVGVLIASLGHTNFKAALLGLFKVPTVYAALLAMLLNRFHVALPLALERTTQLAADGTIPLMLVLLGLELARVEWGRSWSLVALSMGLRLVAAPLVGLLLALPFGLQGAARQASMVETAMPTAVSTTVLASEYRLETTLVTATVFLSTLLSPLTLTPLLVYLGR